MLSKDEIFDLIINDAQTFNSSKQDDMDLSEFDFSARELTDVDFSNCDLVDSSFLESVLTNCNFVNCDLTSVDFTRAKLIECNFSESLLNGTNLSYAEIEYCNFTEADMSGSILLETSFDSTDLSTSENLQAARFDETTIWPDDEYLPEGFDGKVTNDLSSLQDEDDYNTNNDY